MELLQDTKRIALANGRHFAWACAGANACWFASGVLYAFYLFVNPL